MNKEEIKEYLNRVDKLLDKLKGEDKETLSWLIYGYNQCAKLLNETQKENKKLKAEYGTKVQIERDLLKEENQKLKAELQLYKGTLKREQEAIHRVNELEEVIDKAIDYVENGDLLYLANKCSVIYRDNVEVVSICDRLNELLTKLKEVE